VTAFTELPCWNDAAVENADELEKLLLDDLERD